MKALFDTNVAVAALVEVHPHHKRAFPWLKKIFDSSISGIFCAHSLAELYSSLTSLPVFPKISPTQEERLITQNILPHFEIVELSKEDYLTVLRTEAENSIQGGAVYDALIGQAALKAGVDKLLTFNDKHFRRAYPAIADLIEIPK